MFGEGVGRYTVRFNSKQTLTLFQTECTFFNVILT